MKESIDKFPGNLGLTWKMAETIFGAIHDGIIEVISSLW